MSDLYRLDDGFPNMGLIDDFCLVTSSHSFHRGQTRADAILMFRQKYPDQPLPPGWEPPPPGAKREKDGTPANMAAGVAPSAQPGMQGGGGSMHGMFSADNSQDLIKWFVLMDGRYIPTMDCE